MTSIVMGSIEMHTPTRRPLTLVFHEQFTDPDQAIYFEKKFKRWSKKKKEALIAGNYDLLQSLSECRNASHYKYKPLDEVDDDKSDIV